MDHPRKQQNKSRHDQSTPRCHITNSADKDPVYNFYNGFPTPGPQSPSMGDVMSHIYFASEEEWKYVREWGDYDYVVIGSGFCSLAFVDQIRKNDKKLPEGTPPSKILVLERGNMFLPTHFQNLPPVFAKTLPDQVVMTEIFPWSLATSSANLPAANWMHGMVPFFGGRSTLWSAWCPRPALDPEHREVHGWPKEVIDIMKKPEFFERAEKLLNVKKADEIASFIETKLNTNFFLDKMNKILGGLDWKKDGATGRATRVIAAPLAVGDPDNLKNDFTKYSVVADFLELIVEDKLNAHNKFPDRNLVVVTDCIVKRLLRDETMKGDRLPAVAIETSRGVLSLARKGKKTPKVILSVGCMPAATLLMNSFEFPAASVPGSKFGAHTISSVTTRIHKSAFQVNWPKDDVTIGAYYLAGYTELKKKEKTKVGSWHAQISMLQDPQPKKHAGTAFKYMPDVVATATPEQLAGSEDYVVLVFAILGEMEIAQNGLFKNSQTNDPTCNVTLKWNISKLDGLTWDCMEDISHQMIEKLAEGCNHKPQYWDGNRNGWSANFVSFRVPGMVHESSVLPMGPGANDVVGTDFRPIGVENVYVTGSSLWPTATSWNPTMTMSAFSQVLADNLHKDAHSQQ